MCMLDEDLSRAAVACRLVLFADLGCKHAADCLHGGSEQMDRAYVHAGHGVPIHGSRPACGWHPLHLVRPVRTKAELCCRAASAVERSGHADSVSAHLILHKGCDQHNTASVQAVERG